MSGWLITRALDGETIAERYERIGGFTRGFDYLRIGLAIGVVLHHAVMVTDHAAWTYLWLGWPRAIYGQILPAFFALSGFLVAASLRKRPTVAGFLSLRAARLVPALAAEIALSAIVIGAAFTTLPVAEYLSAPAFWSYFLNIVGVIQLRLPGVFTQNPVDLVNGSLWTLPFELECYVALMVLYVAGFLTYRKRLLYGLVGLTALGFVWTYLRYKPEWDELPLPGRYLVVAFLVGVALQIFSDRVRLNVWMFLGSLAVGAALMMSVKTSLLGVFPIAYATIYLGMLHPRRLPLILSGDYSYGLYLFAFPIQQVHAALYPAYRWWGYNAVVAITLGFAYAAFSWWVIEKPILARKRHIADAAERFWRKLIAADLPAPAAAALASDAAARRADRSAERDAAAGFPAATSDAGVR